MRRTGPLPPVPKLEPTGHVSRPAKNDVLATLISVCFHAAVLVFLACWVLPAIARGHRALQFAASDQATVSLDAIGTFEPIDPLNAELDAPVELDPAPMDLLAVEPVLMPEDREEVVHAEPISTGSSQATDRETKAATASVSGAVDRILGDIDARLERGDLLVVWLLDASQSLVDDRRRVAERLEPYYARLVDGRAGSGYQLSSAVVSYGAKLRERVAPTKFGQRIVASVETVPIDRSGRENVFDAVARCAEQYRRVRKDQQILVVVWTDESGDDDDDLEEAIEVCRNQQVSVSVVGPSSVLGAETGLHSYTDPKTQSQYQLPVARGPDTAVPERLELDYWFVSRVGRFRRPPAWQGGRQMVGILSGFSPYALTRLALETGGSYTIFDRMEDRPPFDPLVMARYQPSYQSRARYEQEVRSHPLRRAVAAAVAETRGRNLSQPPTRLFIKRTGDRPQDYFRYYYPPSEFRSRLQASRGRLKGQALRVARTVDKALSHLSKDETYAEGLEDLYRYEKSPRWQAWYDLTRGRLLAASVRLEEYRLVLDEVVKPGALAATTNFVVLVPSQESRCGEEFQRRLDEAERLLRRCASANAGTPWQVLAEQELEIAAGISVREMALSPTGGTPSRRSPTLPRF